MTDTINTCLESAMQGEQSFTLTNEQLAVLDKDRDQHLTGKSKSYSRSEALEIIKGNRSLFK